MPAYLFNKVSEFKKFIGKDIINRLEDLGYSFKASFKSFRSLDGYVSRELAVFNNDKKIFNNKSVHILNPDKDILKAQMLGTCLDKILESCESDLAFAALSRLQTVCNYLESDDINDMRPFFEFGARFGTITLPVADNLCMKVNDSLRDRRLLMTEDKVYASFMGKGMPSEMFKGEIVLPMENAGEIFELFTKENRDNLFAQVREERATLAQKHEKKLDFIEQYIFPDGKLIHVEEYGTEAFMLDQEGNLQIAEIPERGAVFFSDLNFSAEEEEAQEPQM